VEKRETTIGRVKVDVDVDSQYVAILASIRPGILLISSKTDGFRILLTESGQ
jgi:hypothetical protein